MGQHEDGDKGGGVVVGALCVVLGIGMGEDADLFVGLARQRTDDIAGTGVGCRLRLEVQPYRCFVCDRRLQVGYILSADADCRDLPIGCSRIDDPRYGASSGTDVHQRQDLSR
jgi:hypothetical protein